MKHKHNAHMEKHHENMTKHLEDMKEHDQHLAEHGTEEEQNAHKLYLEALEKGLVETKRFHHILDAIYHEP